MNLTDEFERHLAMLAVDGTKGLVAVSGGPDSVALLDLLARIRAAHRLTLVVAHVDHGIHPESHIVARQVADLAARYGLPFESGALRLGAAAGETVARVERYAWLEATRLAVGADLIFLAHHADDQVETVLMRALRGSGPAGLAGMAARRGALVRPLLPFRRSELADYVRLRELPSWSDPANADARHLRAWLRTELLPLLQQRMPEVDAGLLRLADQAAADRTAWDAALDRLPDLSVRAEADGISLARAPLRALPEAFAAALVQAAARRIGCQLGPTRLARVEALLHAGESGAAVPLGGRWRAELSFDRFHLVIQAHTATDAETEPWQLSAEAGEHAWGTWHFRWYQEPAPTRQPRQAWTTWLVPSSGPFTVRRWQPGDAIRPLAGRGRRPVTQCFQEARVPRWRRREWPVVVVPDPSGHDEVAWVPGVCRSDALVPPSAGVALRLDVERVERLKRLEHADRA